MLIEKGVIGVVSCKSTQTQPRTGRLGADWLDLAWLGKAVWSGGWNFLESWLRKGKRGSFIFGSPLSSSLFIYSFFPIHPIQYPTTNFSICMLLLNEFLIEVIKGFSSRRPLSLSLYFSSQKSLASPILMHVLSILSFCGRNSMFLSGMKQGKKRT